MDRGTPCWPARRQKTRRSIEWNARGATAAFLSAASLGLVCSGVVSPNVPRPHRRIVPPRSLLEGTGAAGSPLCRLLRAAVITDQQALPCRLWLAQLFGRLAHEPLRAPEPVRPRPVAAKGHLPKSHSPPVTSVESTCCRTSGAPRTSSLNPDQTSPPAIPFNALMQRRSMLLLLRLRRSRHYRFLPYL